MKPHTTDGISLVFAIIFLGSAAVWLVTDVTKTHLPAAGWVIAIGLIFFGSVGLLSGRRNGRNSDERRPQADADWPGLS
jgi:hypothetical protein